MMLHRSTDILNAQLHGVGPVGVTVDAYTIDGEGLLIGGGHEMGFGEGYPFLNVGCPGSFEIFNMLQRNIELQNI